jgi:cytochrome oxidase Cu insertion factor (SCO1/SenC/PrrC family)
MEEKTINNMENRKKRTSIYTKTIIAAFVPLLVIFLLGICGLSNNLVMAIAIAFVTIPTFYYITKDSSAKEKWIQLPIFAFVMVATHLVGYRPFIAMRLSAFAFAILSVLLIEVLNIPLKTKRLILALLMLFSIPLVFVGSTNLFTYLVAKEMNSRVEQPFPFSYAFVTDDGDTLTDASLKGKNVAVFFWSSHCGSCHKELPHFSELAAQYKDDTTKVFIAAFISFDEASDSASYANEASQESAFTWAKALDSKQVMQDLGFNAFPHVTYINKEGKVVYNGYLSNRPWIFAYHPRKFLK